MLSALSPVRPRVSFTLRFAALCTRLPWKWLESYTPKMIASCDHV